MERVKLTSFSCNIHLNKVENNIVEIMRNHDNYDMYWYNMNDNEKNSFQHLLNIPFDIYVDVFISLGIFRRKGSLIIVNNTKLNDWIDIW
jgi:hypothetical protein